MEKGEMRVEANISVSNNPDKFGTKVEVKNLNSFKSVEGAIAFEIARQIKLLDEGGEVIQETRGWDEVKLKTFTQRVKETAKDYRYFPDPDLPKMNLDKTLLPEIIVKLPKEKRNLYQNLGLTSDSIELIISDRETDELFASLLNSTVATDTEALKLAANYITSDLIALKTSEPALSLKSINAEHFAELMCMIKNGEINSRIAKDLLPELFSAKDSPRALATERNLLQVSDVTALESIVAEIITANPGPAAEYRAGKEATIQFFVGQGMKATRGSANPAVLLEIFKKALEI
jgi:aspartyl-tRNA(Asn)/glutamyl-tRNA(Gln) amidotransferase subunit B